MEAELAPEAEPVAERVLHRLGARLRPVEPAEQTAAGRRAGVARVAAAGVTATRTLRRGRREREREC